MKSFALNRLLVVVVGLFGLLAAPAIAQRARYEAPTAAPPGNSQTIKISQGSLKGSVADGVGWFLGIPYAPPPVGDLRWRPPGSPPDWSGVRDATRAGAVCAENEDCLFLNVVRPATADRRQKLPVMVWIHGGGFWAGTSMGGYGGDTDGHEFARDGVVTVSVNYRLGRAGWFSHPALRNEGRLHSNYGMMDQIAALKWVQDNIEDFGGDPDNVTIFGESAGGVGVLYLMISPEARGGLFQKVIAQSSFARSLPVPLDEAEARGVAVAEAAGVHGADAAAAAALRALPLSAIPLPQRGVQTPGGRPYPVLDGVLIPSTVMAGFEAGREARVPLMIGGTSAESTLTRPTPAMFDKMPAKTRNMIMQVFDPEGAGDSAQAINDFITTQGVTEPDRAIARLHTQHGAPSWTYFFSYVPLAHRDIRPYGAAHTEELPFVFVSPRSFLAEEDLPVAEAMNAYWSAFAKTGEPGTVDGVSWPMWTDDREGQIVFAADGPQAHEHFLKAWRDAAQSMIRK